mgnify:CR=1 FL=1|jgi:hypothetical protein
MGKLLKLSKYRKESRQVYLNRHGAQISDFIHRFLEKHIEVDYITLFNIYQDNCRDNLAEAWDYIEFREGLRDAFEESYFESLFEELQDESWFDSRHASPKQILELCLSTYITEEPRKVLPWAT